MELPLVVAKTRTKTLGAERATSERFDIGVDLTTQGYADIHAILVGTIAETTADQINQGNTPNFILVDGRETKKVDDAKRKVEVFYGSFLQRALMAQIEIELHRAIIAATKPHTGRLSNIREGWEWILISGGKRTTLGGPQDIKIFNPGDALVLAAKQGYAGRVNSLVKRKQGRGFLLDAIDKLRRRPVWRAFSIKAGFSLQHALADEIQKGIGSPFIVVKMARTKYRKAA